MRRWMHKRFGLVSSALLAATLLTSGCGKGANKCGPGERGCACVAQTCKGGLACTAGICTPEAMSPLGVSDSHARSCEVVLADGGGKIDEVNFGDTVIGRWLRQGDKVAAAFFAKQDSPIAGVQVAYTGTGTNSYTVVLSHCYGAKGELLPGATVH
jgi:hypothetical protein